MSELSYSYVCRPMYNSKSDYMHIVVFTDHCSVRVVMTVPHEETVAQKERETFKQTEWNTKITEMEVSATSAPHPWCIPLCEVDEL